MPPALIPCAWPGCDRLNAGKRFCARDDFRARTLFGTTSKLTAEQLATGPGLWAQREAAQKGPDADATACRYPGCKRPLKARGLCSGHYLQASRAGKLETPGTVDLAGLTPLPSAEDTLMRKLAGVVEPGSELDQVREAFGMNAGVKVAEIVERAQAERLQSVRRLAELERVRRALENHGYTALDLEDLGDALATAAEAWQRDDSASGEAIARLTRERDGERAQIDSILGLASDGVTRHDGDRCEALRALRDERNRFHGELTAAVDDLATARENLETMDAAVARLTRERDEARLAFDIELAGNRRNGAHAAKMEEERDAAHTRVRELAAPLEEEPAIRDMDPAASKACGVALDALAVAVLDEPTLVALVNIVRALLGQA